jgi:hypothetical protein
MFLAIVAVLVLGVSSIGRLSAQATGSISGTVTDASGAAISDTSIQVKNLGTGLTRTTQTDPQGRYRFPELGIGDYEISASKMGFSTGVRTGVTLSVGAQPVIDIQLQIGQQTQTVTVEGQASTVETQNTAVGVLVESKQISDLPLNGRNFTQLIALNPGVTQIPQGAPGAGSTFYGNGQKYSIAGSRPSGQAYLLDDQDMVNFWNNGPGAGGLGTALGVEAIAEFQTLTNTYSAQFGGNGAVINASSKAGTNAYHGSLYEFFRNDKLDTRNFFDNVVKPGDTIAKAPINKQNQFGASIGGPIKKDKAFFFVNYEGFRLSQVRSNVVTVPDACVRAATLAATPGSVINSCPGFPATTTSSNAATLRAVQNVMSLYPLPGYVASNGNGTGQALAANPNIGNQDYYLARVDYTVNEKSSIFVRYVRDKANRDTAGAYGYHPELDRTRNHFVNIEERHIISPKLVNLAHIGFSRTYEDAYIYGSPIAVNGSPVLASIATPVTDQGRLAGSVKPDASGLAPGVHPLQFFNVSDPTALNFARTTAGQGVLREDGSVAAGSGITTIAATSTLPFYLVPNKFQFGDDVIWTSGSHSIRIGGSFQRLRENTWAPFVVAPQWTFNNISSFVAGSAATLNGQVSDVQNSRADATKDYRYWAFNMYADDQWKVTSRLTVNVGVRYSPTTIIGSARHEQYNLISSPYGNWVPVTQSTAVNPSLRNFDPRIGLAWDPFNDHKTSIRASFGMFHNVLFSRDTNHWLQPPFLTVTQTGTSTLNGAAAPISFPNPWTNVARSNGGTVIPTDGSLSCTNCDYYGLHTTPYQMQWNFNIQREVMANTVATIGYVGSHNIHLHAQKDWNTPVPFIGPSGRPTFGVFNGSNAVVANARLNPAYASISMIDAMADSTYNALQASLSRRFSHGWQTQVSYTFSKSLDNSSGSYGLDGGGAISNPIDARADRGLSNFNRTNNFRVSGIYAVPFKAKNAMLANVVNGWQITGVYTFLSGAPATVGTIGNRVHNSTGQSGARPDAVAGCDLQVGQYSPEQATLPGAPWFNPGCFTPGPVGTYGNAGRSTIIGPNLWNLDSSVTKDWKVTKISEQFTVQFRGELFNLLNHPSFQNPNTTVFNAALSSAVATNPLAGVAANGTVGRITATNSQPRQIQFALKIIF